MDERTVWVFTGSQERQRSAFPSGVFSTQATAEEWIAHHGLSGTLTMYRVDAGAYDWAIQNGYFRPKEPRDSTPDFIAHFSGGDIHFHYESGRRVA
ncbi:MAG TPA: hypothetical protein VG759_07495 [Candidatus Angelobacter sp.]|jgi:hypothetical protein|nr:hypothetical protein [Candidatus Angelobacter sp.]